MRVFFYGIEALWPTVPVLVLVRAIEGTGDEFGMISEYDRGGPFGS